MNRIGEKIKSARLQKNMAVKQLAKKCGVSESYIQEVESGKKVISESLIKRISNVLDINLNEPMFCETETYTDEPKEESSSKKLDVSAEWSFAFSNIIKDLPIYDADMDKVIGIKYLPIIDKKVEGYNPDKFIYVKIPDDSMSGFRIRKDDLAAAVLNSEIKNDGIYLIEYEGRKKIRHIKKLDGNNILITSNSGDLKSETKKAKEVKIIAHLIKAEISLE